MFTSSSVISILNSFTTAPTECCQLFKAMGSDKGLGWHNYTTLYHALFKELRNTPVRFFELGLGTHNTAIKSHMSEGNPGGSLRAWKQYFSHPDTQIYGADIDRDILFQEPCISTYYVDQLDQQAITDMWNCIPGEMDVILDDGLHTFDANTCFLQNSIHKLKKGGLFIIEDLLLSSTFPSFEKILDEMKMKLGVSFIKLVNIPSAVNKYDNAVCLIVK